jgi:hypothetical protein
MYIDCLNLRRTVPNCPQLKPTIALSVVPTMLGYTYILTDVRSKYHNIVECSWSLSQYETFFHTLYCWQHWHNSLLWNMKSWEIFRVLDFTFNGRNIKLLIFPRPCTKCCNAWQIGNSTELRHTNVFWPVCMQYWHPWGIIAPVPFVKCRRLLAFP